MNVVVMLLKVVIIDVWKLLEEKGELDACLKGTIRWR
jgi:hypothetical protein